MEIDYSLDEARALCGPIVYGLSDGKEIFYVGKTKNPKRRFYEHKTHAYGCAYFLRRLRQTRYIRVIVIADNPDDLAAAEIDAIRRLAPTLINFSANPARTLGQISSGPMVARCPQCNRQIERRAQKLCQTCVQHLLNRDGGMTKQELRGLAADAVKNFRKSA